MQPHVKTHNLRHAYADGTQVDLAGCDLAIWPGDRVAVVGANGAGKSTLFLLLLGMLRPSNGAVEVLGHDPAADYAKIRQRIGVVLQNVEYQILAPTVWEDVSFSPRNYGLPSEETDALRTPSWRHSAFRISRTKCPTTSRPVRNAAWPWRARW